MSRTWPNGSALIPTVTNEFGTPHKLTGSHRGIDLVGYEWNRAADHGTVIFAGENGTAGWEVRILHADGYTTRYLHNAADSLLVSVGDRVSRGQRLGHVGDTGFVNGVHCHFEVIAPDGVTRINPRDYIAAAAPATAGTSNPTPEECPEMFIAVIKNAWYLIVPTGGKPRAVVLGGDSGASSAGIPVLTFTWEASINALKRAVDGL